MERTWFHEVERRLGRIEEGMEFVREDLRGITESVDDIKLAFADLPNTIRRMGEIEARMQAIEMHRLPKIETRIERIYTVGAVFMFIAGLLSSLIYLF